jgi:thiol:disulfide interchange protein/DsbC/DsbD-like thiol-disulfide interchange protein
MTRAAALLLMLAGMLFGAAAPAEAEERHIDVRLLAESEAPAAGSAVTLALVMRPHPGWHGYWQNPGDAGVGTRIDWRLPAGMKAGPIRYPVPERLLISGLMNYVYESEFAQLIDLAVPAASAPGAALPVRGKVRYLACTDKICVPEEAEVSLDLAVGSPGKPPSRRAEFDRYREALPMPLASPGRFERAGNKVRIAIPIPAEQGISDPYFFPLTLGALRYSAQQRFFRDGDLLTMETEAGDEPADAIEGVLRFGKGQGLALAARAGPVPAGGSALTDGGEGGAADGVPILLALGGAFLGGLLLNIMPCVFPILSLKALSLAQAGGDKAAPRRDALAYAAGVILTCIALGGALLALRNAGASAGWAFQLQEPRVILFLLLLVSAIALNLAGLFELPAVGAGDRLTRGGGSAGAFWTGALAAFVATPCTGPFMGAALGAALVLPTAAALAIFAGLGLGLAIPFLLLGFVPALRRRLPRPGPWMAGFRRLLAVSMALTALALAWVLEREAGMEGIAVAAAALLVVALALWGTRRFGWLTAVPAGAAVLAAILLVPTDMAPAAASAQGMPGAQPFSEKKLASLRAEGRPVFVYFTADWCLTCKANEKAVLERDEVTRAFKARHVAVLVGDWTRGDAAIGRFLERHGRSGVPLYLYYRPGKEAEILPQILTPGRLASLGS